MDWFSFRLAQVQFACWTEAFVMRVAVFTEPRSRSLWTVFRLLFWVLFLIFRCEISITGLWTLSFSTSAITTGTELHLIFFPIRMYDREQWSVMIIWYDSPSKQVTFSVFFSVFRPLTNESNDLDLGDQVSIEVKTKFRKSVTIFRRNQTAVAEEKYCTKVLDEAREKKEE